MYMYMKTYDTMLKLMVLTVDVYVVGGGGSHRIVRI